MWLKRSLFCLFLILCSLQALLAQNLANYVPTRSTGISYTTIFGNGGLAFPTWRNISGGAQLDDNRTAFNDIGFDFFYRGVRYSQFSASTNGFIDFSTNTANGTNAQQFGPQNPNFTNNATLTSHCLAAFYDDIEVRNQSLPLGSSIQYLVSGTAPNRVLTVEWKEMQLYIAAGDNTHNLSFQIKIYETTGKIDFIYGTMTQGVGGTYSYSVGLNGPTQTATATASELLTLQTANGTTFNNTEQNNLVALPTSNSSYVFDLPALAGTPSGGVTFSGVTTTGMNVNWTNWCTSEVGYVLYNSTDNVNFTFVTQTAANAATFAATGLNPATTYYWRVYAVNDGRLGGLQTGTQATLSGVSKVSNKASGTWGTNADWTPSGVPAVGDSVTILAGHTYNLNSNGTCRVMRITNTGILQIGTNATNRTLTVAGNIVVDAGGTLRGQNANDNTGNTITISGGTLTNNGTVSLRPTAARLTNLVFNRNGNVTLAGTGTTNTYNNITVNLGTSANNIFDITATNFDPPSINWLTLTNGTIRFSTVNAVTTAPFAATAQALTLNKGFIVNSTNATINLGASITITGNLTVNAGTLNIGDAADENLISDGGVFTLAGGTVNIAGNYSPLTSNILSRFVMTAGTLTVGASGSTSTTLAPFNIFSAGSSCNISGGTIIVQREGGAGAENLGYNNTQSTLGTISGGTLQIGDGSTPAAQTMLINTDRAVGNLLINSANATGQLQTNNLTVLSNVNITAGALALNNLNLTLAGNWTNSSQTFTPGTGTVIFNGTGTQTITDASGEIFSGLTVNKSSGNLQINNNVTVGAALTLTAGNLLINGQTLALNGTVSGSSRLVGSNTSNLSIGGTGALGTLNFDNSSRVNRTLNNLTINRTSTGTATIGSSDTLLVKNTLTITDGTITTNERLMLVSDASGTARVAAITCGSCGLSGNLIVQRYIPGGANTRDWRLLSAPINVSGNFAYSQLIDDTWVTGPGNASNGFDNPGSTPAKPSLRTYNEVLNVSDSWVNVPTINTTIPTGTGFACFVRGSRTLNNPFLINTVPDNTTLDFIGTMNTGTVNFSLSFTNFTQAADGFNLIGNPYPSQIDFAAGSGWTKTNVQNKFWAWNPVTGSYNNYDVALGSGTNGITSIIPAGQGFFVKATAGSASIQFTEPVKTASTSFNYFRGTNANGPNYPMISLALKYDDTLSSNLNRNSSDELLIAFDTLASDRNIDAIDSYKFFNDYMNFYSKSAEGNSLGINMHPTVLANDTINLSCFSRVSSTENIIGNYFIERAFFGDIELLNDFVLADYYTNTFTRLRDFDRYPFQISNDPLSAGNNRFKLLISYNPIAQGISTTSQQQVLMYPNPTTESINIQIAKQLPANAQLEVMIFDLQGRVLSTEKLGMLEHAGRVSMDQLAPGMYMVRVALGKEVLDTQRIIKQ